LASTQTTRVRPYGTRKERITHSSVQRFNNGSKTQLGTSDVSISVGGSQYTESEGHPFLSSRKKGVDDLGGEFFTTKRYVVFGEHLNMTLVQPFTGGQIDTKFSGICTAVNPTLAAGFNSGVPPYSNDVELDALGASAMSEVLPTNPVVNLVAALSELRREGLPHLPGSQTWKRRTKTVRDAGSEYLGVQFGYVPLANDIAGFASTVGNAHSVIEQYKRGIGKPIRREYHFPTVRSKTESVVSSTTNRPFAGQATNALFNVGGTLHRSVEVQRDRWFSGCFTYFFPKDILGSKKLSDLAVLADRLGLTPTPDAIWEATPWSWAVGWFSNIDDVITNWSQFHTHGLVLRYGYMMEHSIVKVRYSWVGAKPIQTSSPPISDTVFVVETKLRRKANPYGFGVGWEGLSSFQLSILAALGITRAR